MITYENFRFLRDGEPLNDDSLNLLTFCEKLGLCPIRALGDLRYRTVVWGDKVFVWQFDCEAKTPKKKRFSEAITKAASVKFLTWSCRVANETIVVSFSFNQGIEFSISINNLDLKKKALSFTPKSQIDMFMTWTNSEKVPKAAYTLLKSLGIIDAIKAEIVYDHL